MKHDDEASIQGVIEAARNIRARSSHADGTCFVVELDDWHALDAALNALDCTCNVAFPHLGDCDVHGLEMPF